MCIYKPQRFYLACILSTVTSLMPNTRELEANITKLYNATLALPRVPATNDRFRKIRKQGKVYVDKTEFIRFLAEDTGHFYFLARPRRSGKTIFLEMLKEFFDGDREKYFKGLRIYDYEEYRNYPVHPVLYFDFSAMRQYKKGTFKTHLKNKIIRMSHYQLGLNDNLHWTILFKKLIELKSSLNKVVILVDEYDGPVEHPRTRGKYNLAEENSEVIHIFFSVVRSCKEHLKLVFVMGVTKYGLGVLGTNGDYHLRDITFDSRYSGMIGFTDEEIKIYFQQHFQQLALKKRLKFDELVKIIRKRYFGYLFSRNSTDDKIYSPYSIIGCLHNDDLDGSSRKAMKGDVYLQHYFKRYPDVKVEDFENRIVYREELEKFYGAVEKMPIEVYMVLIGYLTLVNHYEQDGQPEEAYVVSFPNDEMRRTFEETVSKKPFKELVKRYKMGRFCKDIASKMAVYNVGGFIKTLNHYIKTEKCIAKMKEILDEKVCQSMFLTLSNSCNIPMVAETKLKKNGIAEQGGAIDLRTTYKEAEIHYVWELKFKQRACSALLQIVRYLNLTDFQVMYENRTVVLMATSSRERGFIEEYFAILWRNGRIIDSLRSSSATCIYHLKMRDEDLRMSLQNNVKKKLFYSH